MVSIINKMMYDLNAIPTMFILVSSFSSIWEPSWDHIWVHLALQEDSFWAHMERAAVL